MSSSPTSGALRLARSGAVVTTTLTLAGLGHTVSGGRLPSLWLSAALAVLVGCLGVLITARKLGPGITLVMMGVLQLLLHEALSLLGGHGGAATSMRITQAGGHLHAGVATWGAPLPPQAEHVAMATHAGLASPAAVTMLALHILATLLSAAALAGSERALWQVWAWLQPLFRHQGLAPVFCVHRQARLIDGGDHRPALTRVEQDRRRRGPPVVRSLLPLS
ncbi:hypothetical protein [Kineococcus rubinsiae]|uniref:hypothetical protein n=1 Tax=Kineococcus rubinsiae TaxID=2609562 RepID=UPI00143088A6|nr:hypothetical protein [Kineococcus rubinsiae]NIZ93174.1 hypothetical protein [Kineococcus rubinsiae]